MQQSGEDRLDALSMLMILCFLFFTDARGLSLPVGSVSRPCLIAARTGFGVGHLMCHVGDGEPCRGMQSTGLRRVVL